MTRHHYPALFGSIFAPRSQAERRWQDASAALKDFPRLANGLTPDAVKASPEWRAANAEYLAAFAAYRAENRAKRRPNA